MSEGQGMEISELIFELLGNLYSSLRWLNIFFLGHCKSTKGKHLNKTSDKMAMELASISGQITRYKGDTVMGEVVS